MSLLNDVFGSGAGHPCNFGQTLRRSLGHWRPTTFQQELSVIDDPGTFCVKRQRGDHQKWRTALAQTKH